MTFTTQTLEDMKTFKNTILKRVFDFYKANICNCSVHGIDCSWHAKGKWLDPRNLLHRVLLKGNSMSWEKKKTFLRFLFLKKHIFQACKCEVVHFTSNNFSMMTMCNLHWVFTLGKKYFWGMERQWLQESPYRWGNPVTISIWLLLLPLSKQTTTCYCYTSALA